jgi:hypothetical protein
MKRMIERGIEEVKEDLCKRLLTHLKNNLDPVVIKSLSTQQTNEILRCISDWVYKREMNIDHISNAKEVVKRINNPNEGLEEAPPQIDFMEELKKI